MLVPGVLAVAGLLVEPGDSDDVARAVTRLLSSPSEAAELGRAARRTVEARYTIEGIGNAYCTLYAELLEGRSSRRPQGQNTEGHA